MHAISKPTIQARSLHDRLAKIAADEIVGVLESLQKQELDVTEQDETQVSYAHKLSKQEANIDWQQSAVEIERKIRAFNAWPVAYTYLDEQRLRVWQAEICAPVENKAPGQIVTADKQGIQVATGAGTINLISVQLAGGKVIRAQDFINAHDVQGKCFSAKPTKNRVRASA